MNANRHFAALCALTIVAVAGCTHGNPAMSKEAIRFWLEPSHSEILAGEKVTVVSRSANTIGRDVDVAWETTGGEMETLGDGRAVQVEFAKPGSYIISGTLFVDGEQFDKENVQVRVEPVP